jgi:sulfur-carrier protein
MIIRHDTVCYQGRLLKPSTVASREVPVGTSVQMRLFGSLRAFRPPNAGAFPIKPNNTVGDLLGELGVPPVKVNLAFVNGVNVGLDTPVSDGDIIGIFPQLGGG